MKRLIAAIAALALGTSMISMPVSAAGIRLTDDVIDLKTDEEYPTSGFCGPEGDDEILSWTFDETTGTLTISGEGEMGDFNYYSESEGHYIYLPWLGFCEKINTIIIEDGVTRIGNEAFEGCKNMTSVTIPDSVTEIGEFAFYVCRSLEDITIPDSVERIGGGAFWQTPWLRSKYEEDPLWIYKGTLLSVDSNSNGEIIIPDGVTSIGDSAFYQCSSVESIIIPDGVTSIGKEVFYDCDKLASLTIPDGVTSIGEMAFGDCDKLASVSLPDSITSIGIYAFNECRSLTSVNIPDNVTKIEYGTFSFCDSLESITIPDGVTSIESQTFCECISLESISIPDSVTYVGDNVFENTPWLDAQLETSPFLIVGKTVIASNSETCTGDIVIPEGTARIGSNAFYHCYELTSVNIPESVTEIGYNAFSECTALESVTIENPVCEIYDSDETISNGSDNNYNCYFNGTIYGYIGSTAQEYADKYGYTFESIDSAPGTEDPTEAMTETTTETPTELPTESITEPVTEPPTEGTTDEEVQIGPQPGGSFIFGDGTVLSADEVENSEVKPQLSVSSAEIPENEVGNKEIEISINVSNADKKWGYTGFRLVYDKRLTLVDNGTFGSAVSNLMRTTASYDGGIFITTASSSDDGEDGTIITFKFTLPEDAKAGDAYPIYIGYQSGDIFTNADKDQLMTAYAITNAQPGGITVVDSAVQTTTATTTTTAQITTTTTEKATTKPAPETTAETATETAPAVTTTENTTDVSQETTTTVTEPVTTATEPVTTATDEVTTEATPSITTTEKTTTAPKATTTAKVTTKAPVTTTVPNTTVPEPTVQDLGDVDRSGNIDSSDASIVLQEYALLATGHSGDLTPEQKSSADVNADGSVDSSDASTILRYYAYTATGGKDPFDVFLKN